MDRRGPGRARPIRPVPARRARLLPAAASPNTPYSSHPHLQQFPTRSLDPPSSPPGRHEVAATPLTRCGGGVAATEWLRGRAHARNAPDTEAEVQSEAES